MYYYTIEYWDSIDQEFRIDSGVTYAENYSAATKRIEEYYGIKNIVEIKISELGEILPKDELIDIFSKQVED